MSRTAISPATQVKAYGEVLIPSLKDLYKLQYISHNASKERLLYVKGVTSLQDVVELCKKYCSANNFRFVYVEPAVVMLNLDSPEEEILEAL